MKTIITSYTFNATTGTIDFSSFSGFDVRRLVAVIDLTTKQVIYAVGTPGLGYSSVAGSVVTLQSSMTGLATTDSLQVFYDDPAATVAVTGVATAANQATMISSLSSIATNTAAQSTDTLATGSIAALNAAVVINAQGGFTIVGNITGTWVGTLLAEGLLPDGTNWVQLPMFIIQTTLPYPSTLTVTTNTSVAITGGGYTQVRLRASAWTSGTAVVSLDSSLGQQTVFSAQLGTWNINSVPTDGGKTTYTASFSGAVTAAAATDIFTITGSATKTVRVISVSVSGIQTTAGAAVINLIKRSTANTAGTSTAPSAIPFDSNDPAATATVLAYTANPTVGTQVGTTPFKTIRKEIPTAAFANSDYNPYVWTFGDLPGKAVVLRGTTQVLAVNLNAASLAGNNMSLSVTWTEE
jgi:hypothetical protein